MSSDLGIDVDALRRAFPGLWAIRYHGTPPVVRPGCPVTGWIHEARVPWRVIVARDPFDLPKINGTERVPYTGDEETVDVHEWLNGSRR